MHFALLSNPASGEINVQLSTAQELVTQGHRVTFISSESCSKKIEKFRLAQQPSDQGLVCFISLGSTPSVGDYTTFFLTRMHLMRRPPGDPVSMETCIEAALSPGEEYAATAIKVRDHLDALNPNMICVDALTPSLITGVRLTKRKFILTIPCSPGITALPGTFEPHMAAADRSGSWGTMLENVYLNLREYIYHRTNPDCVAKYDIHTKRFGLKSYGVSRETLLLPPHWEDENCVAGIHFNTLGLNDCPKQSSKMVFVGAGVSIDTSERPCPELAWMNEAMLMGDDVVYMNMGSMFIWSRHEFQNCLSAFEATYKKRGGRVRFLFKTNFPIDSRDDFPTDDVPSYIRLTNWIENQHAIYSHPALKVFIHHGGGNSFNEAVYFAVPQLVLSQWLDTHEYAGYAQDFSLGLRSECPPQVDADDIEAKLLTLLGPQWPTFKAHCETWAVRSQIGGGAASAARIVLSHAASTGMEDAMPTPPFTPVEASTFEEKDSEALKGIVICS